ncbi:MAG: hypothetical protein KDJ99_32705 [Candidatus Competibacteraceae bacterium]|nr:hypothetical protein [Candidatus Competibacteraceae bacterium]
MSRQIQKCTMLSGLLAASALAPVVLAKDAATVEELSRIIEQQQRQLEAQARTLETLQQQVQSLQQPQPAAAAVDTAVAKDAPGVVQSGGDRVKLSVSGQVNRGVLFTDDGKETEVFNVDNSNSSTRIRFIGELQANDDLTIGSNIEVQFESNASSRVNQDDQRNVGPNNFTERKLELYADSKRYGRLSLGQGDTASNSSSEVDLSGTGVIGYSSVSDMAGGILFRDADTGELTGTNIGSVFSNLDGLSRDDRIRYDTPSFGGVNLSTSFIADDRWDMALRFAGDFGSFKTAAAIAYADPNEDDFDSRISGSASLLHASGFNVTGAAGSDDYDDRDPDFWYIKLGYQTDSWASWGLTALAVDYYSGDEIALQGDESESYGAFVVQQLDDYGTELYFGLRNYSLDRRDENLDDVFAVLAGARAKF